MSTNSEDLSKIAILTPSCDRYSDLWECYLNAKESFWPKCRLQHLILSNHIKSKKFKSKFSNLTILPVGDCSWSDAVIRGLEYLKTDYVFLWLEDLILTSKVDSELVENVISSCIELDLECLSLCGRPKPVKPFMYMNDLKIGRLPPKMLYRVSTVGTLWKSSVLLKILKSGETAWQFEIVGADRSNFLKNFFSVKHPLLHLENCVIKGKWQRSSLKKMIKLGFASLPTQREVMSTEEEFVFKFLKLRSLSLSLLPYKIRSPIRKFFLRSN